MERTILMDKFLGEREKRCKKLCKHCAKGIKRVRGEDDMGAEWWHPIKKGATVVGVYGCFASDFLEGRLK